MSFTIKTIACITGVTIFCHPNLVFSQIPDTILITPQFRTQAIGANCFHRVGNDFETYVTGSKEWSGISVPNYWLSPDNIHWIYAVIKNTDTVDRTLKLYLNNVQAGIIKMYFITNGRIDSTRMTGSLLRANQRASRDRTLSIPFIIPSGKVAEIYLKSWRRELGITLTLTLHDTSFTEASIWTDYLLLIILTFIFLILLTAIIVLIYSPSKETFWFLIYILSGFFYVLAASGFGSLYLWSAFPWFEENAPVFLGAVSTAAFFEFSRRVLRLRDSNPFINVLLIVFSISYPLIGLLGFGLSFNLFAPGVYSKILQFPYLLMLICFVIVFCLSVYKAAFKKKKEFWWFVSIFSFYILMAFVMVLLERGYLKYDHKMHAVLLAFGALPQMTLTLFFLINRILNLLRKGEREITDIRMQGQQAILNERLRVSRELHDDVGATLSGIAMYSHLTKQQLKAAQTTEVEKSLTVMQQSAGEMVNKLNDIVWLINPDQDTLQKLVERLEEYATDMAAIKNMKVKITVPDKIAEISLPIDSRRNIYLFCKEAINNAVKYSQGSMLELTVKEVANKLEFSVSDNGKGFDAVMVKRGNGLENMQKRADEIGAKLILHSKLNEGALVSLQCKITQ